MTTHAQSILVCSSKRLSCSAAVHDRPGSMPSWRAWAYGCRHDGLSAQPRELSEGFVDDAPFAVALAEQIHELPTCSINMLELEGQSTTTYSLVFSAIEQDFDAFEKVCEITELSWFVNQTLVLQCILCNDLFLLSNERIDCSPVVNCVIDSTKTRFRNIHLLKSTLYIQTQVKPSTRFRRTL